MIKKLRKHQSIDINRRINLPKKKKKKNFKNLSKGQLLPIKKKIAQLDLSSLQIAYCFNPVYTIYR